MPRMNRKEFMRTFFTNQLLESCDGFLVLENRGGQLEARRIAGPRARHLFQPREIFDRAGDRGHQ